MLYASIHFIFNDTDNGFKLLSQVDVTLRQAQKIKGARHIPPGFFNNALREANVCNLHLLLNTLINILLAAYSSIPIQWAE
jgi:hypothetical protein